MKKIFIIACLLVCFSLRAYASVKIKNQGPLSFLEKSSLILSGSKLSSTKNPFKTKLITADGQKINLITSLNSAKNQVTIYLPGFETGAPSLIRATLAISGGNVAENKPQQMVILLSQRPQEVPGKNPPGNIQDLPYIPANASSGIEVDSNSGSGTGLKPALGTDYNVNNQISFNASGVNFVKFFDTDSNVDLISTISNGVLGQILIIKFLADVDFADNDSQASNSIDLEHSGSPTVSFYQRDTLTLIFDGVHWSELNRSINSL